MTYDPDVLRRLRVGWLHSILEISDIEAQRRLWLNPENRNPHFSYVEYFESYFDVLPAHYPSVSELVEHEFISRIEASAVSEFHETLLAHESPTHDYDNEAILSDPKWREVVTAAQQARNALLEILEVPEERAAIHSDEEWSEFVATNGAT